MFLSKATYKYICHTKVKQYIAVGTIRMFIEGCTFLVRYSGEYQEMVFGTLPTHTPSIFNTQLLKHSSVCCSIYLFILIKQRVEASCSSQDARWRAIGLGAEFFPREEGPDPVDVVEGQSAGSGHHGDVRGAAQLIVQYHTVLFPPFSPASLRLRWPRSFTGVISHPNLPSRTLHILGVSSLCKCH